MIGYIKSNQKDSMISDSIQYAMSNSILHGNVFNNEVYYTNMSYSLLPVPFKRDLFERSVQYSKLFDKLCIKMIEERKWMFNQLEKCSDEFVSDLLTIAKKAIESPYYQPLTLGIFRSDYMINEDQKNQQSLLQIELNTVSCSFVGVMEKISDMHKYMINKYGNDESILQYYNIEKSNIHNLPDNKTIENTSKAFMNTLKVYPSVTGKSSILFVVQDNETNGVDQYLISNYIHTHSDICCYYKTVKELLWDMTIEDGVLYVYIDKKHTIKQEIGLVYYRSCYNPSDLNTPELLKVREQLECCRAIKCPNVLLQLSGMKTIQQALCEQNALELFLSKDESSYLRQCFAGIWAIDTITPTNKEAIEDAIQNPDKYVLKPQREGGGNLIWGQDISKILTNQMSYEYGKEGLILMTKIQAQQYPAIHIIDKQPNEVMSIHEYGVYSYVLGGDHTTYNDNVFGHLFKTKESTSMEGGVCAGFACLNTAYLIDN